MGINVKEDNLKIMTHLPLLREPFRVLQANAVWQGVPVADLVSNAIQFYVDNCDEILIPQPNPKRTPARKVR